MSSSLTQLCDLVSSVALANASKLREQFVQLVRDEGSDVDPESVLTILAFMNWTFAQGVWSNLSNTHLRRDLQVQLKDALILRLARALTESSSAPDIAARAVTLTDEFNDYLRHYKSRMQALGDADSRTATLFAFERIQERYGVKDGVMNRVIPRLILTEGLKAELESVAQEINKAAAQKKTGFFSRPLRGRS